MIQTALYLIVSFVIAVQSLSWRYKLLLVFVAVLDVFRNGRLKGKWHHAGPYWY